MADAEQGDHRADDQQSSAKAGDQSAAEAVHQRSGDERREEHAEHVPLDDLAAGLQIQTFAMHRQGRGVHHQDHQAVAGSGGQHRGANGRPCEQRLPADRRRIGAGRRHSRGRRQPGQDHEPQRRQTGDQQIGAGEGHASEIARHMAERGRDQRRQHATADHAGRGATLEGIAHRFQRGEAVIHRRGLIGANGQSADTEQGEAVEPERQRADQPAQHAGQRTDEKAGAATAALHQARQWLQGEQAAEHQQGQRQGGETGRWCQAQADDGGEDDAGHRTGPEQRLGDEQAQDLGIAEQEMHERLL